MSSKAKNITLGGTMSGIASDEDYEVVSILYREYKNKGLIDVKIQSIIETKTVSITQEKAIDIGFINLDALKEYCK